MPIREVGREMRSSAYCDSRLMLLLVRLLELDGAATPRDRPVAVPDFLVGTENMDEKIKYR